MKAGRGSSEALASSTERGVQREGTVCFWGGVRLSSDTSEVQTLWPSDAVSGLSLLLSTPHLTEEDTGCSNCPLFVQ